MILPFHKKRKPHVEWLPRLEEAAAEEPHAKTRKPNKRGAPLRARIAAFLRRKGRASLTELNRVFGGPSVVVGTLLTMAENGEVVVLNNDWFSTPQ